MSEFWEVIKGVGAIVALITAGILLWERLVKERPLVMIIARPLVPGGKQFASWLQIRNRSARPILVTWQSGSRPGRFSISTDSSIRGIVAALAAGRIALAVDGEETRELVLLRPYDYDEFDLDNRLEFEIFWSFAQPISWQRDRSIRGSISKRSYQVLLNEADRGDDD